jgi:hypothetical protein
LERILHGLTVLRLISKQFVKKGDPAGVGPATKRIQAQIQFGYSFTLFKEQLLT